MADDANTDYKTGDSQYHILRKILARLNLGISTSGGSGGGGSGGGAVTIADGADVAEGTRGDVAAGDSTSAWTVISMLKGIYARLAATLTVGGTVAVSNLPATQPVSGTVAVSNFPATQPVSGTVAVSAIAAALPAGTNVIGHVITDSGSTTAVTGDVAVTSAGLTNLDVALSTRLKPADTLAGVTTVTTVSTVAAITSGNVGGFTTVIKDTAVVSTSPAYTAGDAVGAKRTLANAVRVSGGTGILDSVTLLDRANQKAAMELILFDSDPASATITDNAAFVYSTDDLKVLARITIGPSDYVTLNGKAIAQLKGLSVALKIASGTSLFAALVTTGTPTFVATTDVQLSVGILQD